MLYPSQSYQPPIVSSNVQFGSQTLKTHSRPPSGTAVLAPRSCCRIMTCPAWRTFKGLFGQCANSEKTRSTHQKKQKHRRMILSCGFNKVWLLGCRLTKPIQATRAVLFLVMNFNTCKRDPNNARVPKRESQSVMHAANTQAASRRNVFPSQEDDTSSSEGHLTKKENPATQSSIPGPLSLQRQGSSMRPHEYVISVPSSARFFWLLFSTKLQKHSWTFQHKVAKALLDFFLAPREVFELLLHLLFARETPCPFLFDDQPPSAGQQPTQRLVHVMPLFSVNAPIQGHANCRPVVMPEISDVSTERFSIARSSPHRVNSPCSSTTRACG